MRRLPTAVALGIVLAALCAATTAAESTRASCVRAGERAVASSPRLILLAPSDRSAARRVRLVCRRDFGTRRTLVRLASGCSHCGASLGRVVLRGRFAYAVVSRRTYNDQQAELVTLDTATWRTRRAALDLGDQNDDLRTDVTDLVALPRGRAVLRVRNDFAAGIVLAAPGDAAALDEGLTTAIGRPRFAAGRVTWRHGAAQRFSPALLADRCPRAPAPPPSLAPGGGQILASADVVTSGGWYCVRATGAVGRLDGVVVRLLGSLAAVQRRADVRLVDLSTATTVAGPAASDAQARSSPGIGPSGTLVLRRPGACAGDAEIVALVPGLPERRLACGDLRDLRYVDGLVRWRDHATGTVVTAALP